MLGRLLINMYTAVQSPRRLPLHRKFGSLRWRFHLMTSAPLQSARMARLITSGDGTLIQAELSTSGELPPHIGPLNRQNSLEFLPVLPPMHVHSHPVTTGHGQFVSFLFPGRSSPQMTSPLCAFCQSLPMMQFASPLRRLDALAWEL